MTNEQYRKVVRQQLREGTFCASFEKQNQMDYLLPAVGKYGGGLAVADLCCGYGRLTYFMNEQDPSNTYIGVDFVQENIDRANELFRGHPNVSFVCYDVDNLSGLYEERRIGKPDLSVHYKTLSWLPYYTEHVREMIKNTKRAAFITSLFWEGDIDFITRIYPNASKGDEEEYTYLNTYSMPKFAAYCKALGAKEVKFSSMPFTIDLPRPDPNRLETYTVKLEDSTRLELTGVVALNWKLVEIVL